MFHILRQLLFYSFDLYNFSFMNIYATFKYFSKEFK